MVKFSQVRLSDGKLRVTGPSEAEGGLEVKHLRFVVSQGAAMVEDQAELSGSGWHAETDPGDLRAGPAYGCGLAVMIAPGPPPTFQTVTWMEPLRIAQG